MNRYLSPQDVASMLDSDTGGFPCTIRCIAREIIDRRPQLVLYIEEDPRGIILTRVLYQDLAKTLGRSPLIEEFFAREGLH